MLNKTIVGHVTHTTINHGRQSKRKWLNMLSYVCSDVYIYIRSYATSFLHSD